MTISAYLNQITMQLCGMLPAAAPEEADKLIFVNDIEDVCKQKVVEAKTWYSGDSDELANLYRVDAMIEFRTEPYYWKNKRNYFWAVGVTENEYKMSHSGFARDMCDTLVSICGTPILKYGLPQVRGIDVRATLEDILEQNDFWSTYRKVQMPMTMVTGWGGWKIDWSPSGYGAVPIVYFMDALGVRFHKVGPMTIGMTFLQWYGDGKGNRFLLAETRAKAGRKGTYKIVYNCFKEAAGYLSPVDEIPGMRKPRGWNSMPVMFSVPCSFYADNLHGFEGRGIYEGKIDLLDDLDQALSVQTNTARRLTPIDVFDLDYCDRDPRTKLPKLPKSFERKYVGIRGKVNASGDRSGTSPVVTTQPSVSVDVLEQYVESLKRTIISGHLSPATMGIDVDKRAGQDTLHERNKETVFTRNHLVKEETRILEDLFNQIMIAQEWLSTGRITVLDYGIKVEFDEFSDVSFESKLDSMVGGYSNGAISPEMFVDKLYGKSISDETRAKEIQFLKEDKDSKRQAMSAEAEEGGFGMDPMAGAEEGPDVSGDEERD